MAQLSNEDLYWLAGILEGEGSFGLTRCHVKGKCYKYPLIQLNMTDEDIVERVAKLYGSLYRGYRGAKPGNKNRFSTTLTNKRADELMRVLYPIMGKRRQKRIREVLVYHRVQQERPFGSRGTEK